MPSSCGLAALMSWRHYPLSSNVRRALPTGRARSSKLLRVSRSAGGRWASDMSPNKQTNAGSLTSWRRLLLLLLLHRCIGASSRKAHLDWTGRDLGRERASSQVASRQQGLRVLGILAISSSAWGACIPAREKAMCCFGRNAMWWCRSRTAQA